MRKTYDAGEMFGPRWAGYEIELIGVPIDLEGEGPWPYPVAGIGLYDEAGRRLGGQTIQVWTTRFSRPGATISLEIRWSPHRGVQTSLTGLQEAFTRADIDAMLRVGKLLTGMLNLGKRPKPLTNEQRVVVRRFIAHKATMSEREAANKIGKSRRTLRGWVARY
jgi:hypothetical protein